MIYTKVKSILTFVLSVVLIFTMTSCSATKNYDSLQLSEKILELTTFSEMKELSGASLPYHFFFKDGDVKRFNVWVSATDESADTLACFEVKNDEQRSTVITGIKKYLNDRSNPTMELEKIENRLLVELGDIIILVICNDTAPVWDYLNKLGAKEVI